MLALPVLASVVETLSRVAEPWKNTYDDSTVLQTLVVFVHIGALLVAGGFALSSDRDTLRAAGGDDAARARQLEELGLVHRIIVSALVVVALSGVLLFFTDVETFATSIAFWVKMGLVAALLLNGLLMTRGEATLRAASRGSERSGAGGGMEVRSAAVWGRLRTSAIVSIALWLATTLAGVALLNAA
jgi:hypothetical protein